MTNNSSRSPAPKERGNRAGIWTRLLRSLGGHRRLLWISAALFLVLLAVAAFFSLQKRRQNNPTHAEIGNPETIPPPSPPVFKEIVDSFQPNQTVTEVLLEAGLPRNQISQIVECARPVYNLAKVKAKQSYWLRFTQDGKFRDFRYPVDDERYLTIYHDEAEDCFVSVMKNFKFDVRTETVSAVIEDSLYASIVNIGEEYQLALDLADIFGYDIDFNTDIQKGDSFRALVEKKYLDGQFVQNGAILAASLSNQQKLFTGYRFEDENGKPAYYAPDGKALKRSFLKSPLKVFRITSRFSYARLHPILKVVRPHLGVDYAAPIGTPVQAVGAGVVLSAGQSGANGKMVRIRHAGGYETRYLHLSRIAVKAGARVDQGQVVGYVGSSGLSAGPHLDFRILRHGTPLNPTKVIFPPANPVSPDKFERFAALRDELAGKLQSTHDASKQASATGNPLQ